MIFGHLGFPCWGLAGAAIATIISQWARLLIYIVLIFLQDQKSNKFHILGGMRLDIPLLGRLCYYGIPAGLYAFMDTVTFTAFILLIGGLGEVQRDATTIAFTLNSFTYIPLNGIGIVVASMVGNQLGKNRPDLARRATMTAQCFGCIYAGFFGLAFLVLPDLFLFPFAQTEGFAEICDLTVLLLRFVALYLFFDSCAVIFCAALRGAGDTFFIACVTGILGPLLPVFCVAGIYFFGLGVFWCWVVLTVDIFIYCIAFSLRYRSKVWESMRVIEKELI
jgi:MATE family multidrug resistance protein